jgi:hypothetical protein
MKVVTDSGTYVLGTTEAKPTIGIVDYSRRVTDDFGVTTVVERGFSRRMSVRFALPFAAVDEVRRRFETLRAKPAQWIADDRFTWLSFEGFYKDFELDLAIPPLSFCTLTVEGLAEKDAAPDPGGDPAPEGRQSTMLLVQPTTVAGGALANSNVPENDYPEWSAEATYAEGARVIKAATHRIYESTVAANIGNDPAGASGKWLDVGPTNRWAMFDQALGTKTSAADLILVTLLVPDVDAVALLDVVGNTVRVEAPGYDRELPVVAGAVTFLDMPVTGGPVVVRVMGTGTVSVGTLLIGKLVALGTTEASPRAGINDFSRKEVDEFGEPTIVERAWAKRMSTRALIRTDAIDVVANRIAAVRAKPSLWIGDEGTDSLTVYGFFKDFSIEVGENVSTLSLSIEGLSQATEVGGSFGPPNWTDVIDNDPVNHPKPEDGATVGAPPWAPVGDRPAHEITEQLDTNGWTLIEQIMRVDAAQALIAARTLIDGVGVNTVITEFKSEQTGINFANASRWDMIGSEAEGGASFIIHAEAVRNSAGESVAASLDTISSTLNGQSASIDDLRDTLIDASGATARAIFKLDVNGYISGLIQTNNGEESEAAFLVDKFSIIDDNGGSPFKPFSYANGVVTMPDVEIGLIRPGTKGTVGMPVLASASAATAGQGTSTPVTLLTTAVALQGPGTVTAQFLTKLDHNDGAQPWDVRLFINGIQVFRTWGEGSKQDSVPAQGSLFLNAAGTYTVSVQLRAPSSVVAHDRNIICMPIHGS